LIKDRFIVQIYTRTLLWFHAPLLQYRVICVTFSGFIRTAVVNLKIKGWTSFWRHLKSADLWAWEAAPMTMLRLKPLYKVMKTEFIPDKLSKPSSSGIRIMRLRKLF